MLSRLTSSCTVQWRGDRPIHALTAVCPVAAVISTLMLIVLSVIAKCSVRVLSTADITQYHVRRDGNDFVLRHGTVQVVQVGRQILGGDRLCGLVVRVLGYRSGGPGSIPGTTRKKVVGLERGPLSLVSTTEELLDRKVAAPV
jgi:hypothetical protein